jgi:coiled-coil domain-containing protein 61
MGSFEVSYRMVIDCEDKLTGDIWRGDYQQKYIEEITNKAKNFKKFNLFAKMLLSALKRE